METAEWQWLHDERSLKDALQKSIQCSGQLLKKHFSAKELARPQRSRDIVKLPLDLVNHLQINPLYQGPQARILKETNEYIALHKPGRIHSHPLRYGDTNTVLNYLVQEGKWDALMVNERHYDRGLLYRLDYETSGVLVLAKNEAFFVRFREGFHSEIKRKLYWAVVDGSFNREGEWTHHFIASGAKGSKQNVTSSPVPGATPGTFRVRKILEAGGKSLLLIDLKSGLRHQIRAQLAALGFPILGDELYGGPMAPRLFLHAWRYEWEDVVEDTNAELFFDFFDLNRALQMSHNVLSSF